MAKKTITYHQPDVRFVLVEPSHPGNIGAVARALKVMTWQSLYLVKPKKFPDAEATARAAGAADLLLKAVVVEDLSTAIKDCSLVLGTSIRKRGISLPLISSFEIAQFLQKEATYKMAILFGRENNGLSNEELNHCHYQLYIPANPLYSSLNLASAVQIISYELAKCLAQINYLPEPCHYLANSQQYGDFYQRLSTYLPSLGFDRPSVLTKLKNIFNRARLSYDELQLLNGIFKANQK